MTDALFVYGSLRSEFDNQYVARLRDEAEWEGRATVRGALYLAGRYPGYRSELDGMVHGEVWRLREPGKTLAVMDEYEGSKYLRVKVSTSLGEAWIYEYARPVASFARIESGDFLAR